MKSRDESRIVVQSNMIEYPVTIQGIPMTLRYTVEQDKVKEEFIIDQKPQEEVLASLEDNLKFVFDMQSVGLNQKKVGSEYFLPSPVISPPSAPDFTSGEVEGE